MFGALLWLALQTGRYAEQAGQLFAARLAEGIGALLVIQALINIGVNLGVLPTKGLTLPFISYGGSSMLMCCAAMGFLFAVQRQCLQTPLVKIGETLRVKVGVRKPSRYAVRHTQAGNLPVNGRLA